MTFKRLAFLGRPVGIILFLLIWTLGVKAQENLVQYVNPFIGTGGHGHTFPGATRPFGLVQLSPDNGTAGWDWNSGYHYSDNRIIGFSHMHLSGTGIGDWLDISVFPLLAPLEQGRPLEPVTFSHENETASPGYYSVRLDNGILAELTASRRVGFHQYSFPENSKPVIRFDMQFHINGDVPTHTLIKKLNDSTIVGYRYSTGQASTQRVYFAARTSEPFEEFFLNGEIQIEGGDMELGLSTDGKNEGAIAQLVFEENSNAHLIRMKVGLSMTGVDQALLALSEIPHWDFNQVKLEAAHEWQKELEKVQITTEDERFKRIFYTALYHTAIAPTTYSDRDGHYQNAQGDTLKMAEGKTRYTVFPLWNTYRALNPLLTLIQPERYGDMLESILAFYKENGVLPIWDLGTAETHVGAGYPAIPVLADAILKNWPDLDQQEAFEAMKSSARKDSLAALYARQGYIPQEETGPSVTMTLEYRFGDYSIARTAAHLGDSLTYKTFAQRAKAYQRIFDAKTGFMRARDKEGAWLFPFDPFYSEQDNKYAQYLDGNAWQYAFYVLHDVQGLASLYERKDLEAKLDSLFSVSSVVRGDNASPAITGLIGQYAHGNEPSHHIAYMYNYLGKAWKTQEKVRLIADSMYSDLPDGYVGNEDVGQMSAWLIWSVSGMYPVNPVGGEYVIGSPMVDAVRFQLKDGKELEIIAQNNQKDRPYIQSVTFNGKPYDKTYFRHQDLIKGGKIVFTMGAKPNESWGKRPETWPGSMTPVQTPGEEDEGKDRKGIFERIKAFFEQL